MTPLQKDRWWLWGVVVLVAAAFVAGATVAGPGLSWDEPAYRHSQVTLQSWFRELAKSRSLVDVARNFSADAIDVYFEYNRFGHNFHPPMGGYLNLATYGTFGGWIDDISARRLASCFEFAGCVAMLFVAIGRRFGVNAGLFAATSLLFMPRVMGNAHLIDTDVPLLFFWSATAFAFEAGLDSRRWQWLAGVLFGCLILVKFSGIVVLGPCAVWYFLRVILRTPWRTTFGWLIRTTLILSPLLAYAALFVFRPNKLVRDYRVVRMTTWGLDSPLLFWICLFTPAAIVAILQWRHRARDRESESQVAFEAPWTLLAVGPLVAVLLNPTWWHDPVYSLASYFNLNLDRQSALPNIGIYYLGKRYFYSLPWHNAPVLMAVTIPFGTLILGTLGSVLGVRGMIANDRLRYASYLLLHAWTLPVFRMFHTPAHDGVRLFLPTFFFWAGLAGIGACWLANRFGPQRNYKWALVWLAGPMLSAYDWGRIHPFELSYYNIGLKRAFDNGFEATYWYDCVTPKVLDDLNAKLPQNTPITHLVDPLINAEVFSALYQLGRVRKDIDVDPPNRPSEHWVWLTTHSSKATAFTRLLYSCKAWYESGKDDVKLFCVLDPPTVQLCWALWSLAVDGDSSDKLGSLRINELAFQSSAADLRRATELLGGALPDSKSLESESPGVRELTDHWLKSGRLHPTRSQSFRDRKPQVLQAIELLTTRGPDIHRVLENDGYLSPNQFGGWFEPNHH